MADQLNNQTGELPMVQGAQTSTPIAPNVPSAPLHPVPTGEQTGVVQESMAILMNTELLPREMAARFASIKESNVAKTYGIIIE
jgi:hypothetical protein